MNEYMTFLARKQLCAHATGFTVPSTDLSTVLFPFQRAIVQWALRLGRAAIFAERGLGKTVQQVEWARQVVEHTGGRVLIVCPLAVAHQTIAEAKRLLGVDIAYVRSHADVVASSTPIVITNYEMLLRDTFDPQCFVGVVLDESSKLKTFTGATKRYLITAFAQTPYRLCCTATPSPNDTTELGNHAEFLGVMTAGEMLTRWFIRESNSANTLRLKGHAIKDFWRWVASWAVCVGKPSDVDPRYDDTGYVLPPLDLLYEVVAVDHRRAWDGPTRFGMASLFLDGNQSATTMWAEKRATLQDRAARAAALVEREPSEPWIVWHDTDYERDALLAALPEATVVTGSQAPHLKERLLDDFTTGATRIMATKPRIGGWGLNWQHCARMVFVGVTHKWEEFYQALGRCHRFGQHRAVQAHIVYAESEYSIIAALHHKWHLHEEMRAEMIAAMRAYGLAAEHRRFGDERGMHPMPIPSWIISRGPA